MQGKLYQEAEKFVNEQFYNGTFDKRSTLRLEDVVHAKLLKDDAAKDIEYYGHRDGVVHSSSLYGCIRGTLHEMLGTEPDKEPDARKLGIFKAGNLFEDFVVEALGEKVLHRQREYTYKYKSITLVGRSDFTIDDNGVMRVGENKSVHSDSFWYREREGTLVQWHNQLQLQIYMWLERELNGNAWDGIFAYISKDDCTISSTAVKYNPAFIEEIVKPVLDIINERYVSLKPLADQRNEVRKQLAQIVTRTPEEQAASEGVGQAIATQLEAELKELDRLINEGVALAPAPEIAIYSASKNQFQKNWLCTYCDYHCKCAGAGWVLESANLVSSKNKELKAGGAGRPAKPIISVQQ